MAGSRTIVRPSKTAELAAAIRAVHLRRAQHPVFRDELAMGMLGPFWRTVASSRLLRWIVIDGLLGRLEPVSPEVLLRARFGEDRVRDAVAGGIDQYVIIGAGYETFAMRRRDLAGALRVWELDLPATQDLKRRRMRKAGLEEPGEVTYVAVDLTAETLKDALERSGFDAGRPALFSWFGVTYYLDEEAIRRTLGTIVHAMAPGSSIMFDYLADPAFTPAPWRHLQGRLTDFVARRGEPWVTSYPPHEVPGFLEELGFARVEHLEPGEIGAAFSVADAGLDYPPFFGFVFASTAK